jgi:hypothetical protein
LKRPQTSIKSVPFGGGVVFFSTDATTPNSKISMLTRTAVCGEALVIPAGLSGRRLFNLLRPELIAANPCPLSSDSFTNFALNDINRAKHEAEVRDASKRLLQSIIPAIAKDIDANSLVILNGKRCSKPLHQHGVNM